jgi:hypothetical protein
MSYHNIQEIQPDKEYVVCSVKTNWNRTIQAIYHGDLGIFYTDDDEDKEIGWKDNGEQPELITHWKEIKPNKMKVTVKYQIINSENLSYEMFQENGEMIENKRITDRKVPLGGIASNLDWLKQDVHCFTEEIKGMFPDVEGVDYVLIESE